MLAADSNKHVQMFNANVLPGQECAADNNERMQTHFCDGKTCEAFELRVPNTSAVEDHAHDLRVIQHVHTQLYDDRGCL